MQMTKALLFLMNAAVLAVVIGVAFIMDWTGPAFTYGVIAGGLSLALYLRLKLGYWP